MIGEILTTTVLIKAIAILLIGLAAFDLMSVIVRMLGDVFPILQISVLRNFFGVIPALILLLIGPGFTALKEIKAVIHWKVIVIRSAAVLVAQVAYYTALTKIEFATAATLCFTSPFFVTLLSIPLLGHNIGYIRFAAVFVGFFGVAAILRPFGDDFTFWMLLPVVAGFGYGLSSVLVKLIPNEVPSAAVQIAQQIITFFIGACFLIIQGDFMPIVSWSDLFYFVLMGFCGGVGVLCLIISYRLVDPSSISVFEYFGIPISFAMGWLFFNEAPISTLFPGAFLLIGAGLLIMFREKRLASADKKGIGK